MIYTNKKMAELLNRIDFDRFSKQKLNSISAVVSPRFVEIEDCILISNENEDIAELNMSLIYKVYGDKSGFEASNNHIHTSQYVDDDYKSPTEGLKLAMYILDAWKTKLKEEFPKETFHLILSYDGEESTLRFHKYRKEEGSWLIIDDLDGYKEEAILITVI